MLLDGRRIVVTGVLSPTSIAFAVAALAQAQGAEVVLTSFGRARPVTERAARRLAGPPPVLELDVTEPAHLEAVAADLGERWGRVDGVVHAIAAAPPSCLGDGFTEAEWPDVASTLQVSAYSLQSLTAALLPLMPAGSAVVGLDFDASRAWPLYSWMGVAKAALESTARYLAREVGERGVRVNLVAAGPLRTIAARSIPGFDGLAGDWTEVAPLGWSTDDADPVARACVALLSPWFPATTGEIVHVDGGVHAVGGS